MDKSTIAQRKAKRAEILSVCFNILACFCVSGFIISAVAALFQPSRPVLLTMMGTSVAGLIFQFLSHHFLVRQQEILYRRFEELCEDICASYTSEE